MTRFQGRYQILETINRRWGLINEEGGLYHYWCQKGGMLTFESLSYWVGWIPSSFNLVFCILIGRYYHLPCHSEGELKIESSSPFFWLVGNAETILMNWGTNFVLQPAPEGLSSLSLEERPSCLHICIPYKTSSLPAKRAIVSSPLNPHNIQGHLLVLYEL